MVFTTRGLCLFTYPVVFNSVFLAARLLKRALGIISRYSVNVPLATGIIAIDLLFPVGHGQRELIFAERGIGKTVLGVVSGVSQQRIVQDLSRVLYADMFNRTLKNKKKYND